MALRVIGFVMGLKDKIFIKLIFGLLKNWIAPMKMLILITDQPLPIFSKRLIVIY